MTKENYIKLTRETIRKMEAITDKYIMDKINQREMADELFDKVIELSAIKKIYEEEE